MTDISGALDALIAQLEAFHLSSSTKVIGCVPRPIASSDFGGIRERLVLRKEPVLFVGESGSRALPWAIAALRGSLAGIVATDLENPTNWGELTVDGIVDKILTRVKLHRGHSSWCDECKNSYDIDTALSTLIASLIDDEQLLASLQRLYLTSINAHFLGRHMKLHDLPTRNILWQAPWYGDVSGAILGFIRSASSVQRPGDALFLGLTSHQRYVHRYNIEGIKKTAQLEGYVEIPVDTEFISMCIAYGYKHESDAHSNGQSKDWLHPMLMHFWVIYGFIKPCSVDTQAASQNSLAQTPSPRAHNASERQKAVSRSPSLERLTVSDEVDGVIVTIKDGEGKADPSQLTPDSTEDFPPSRSPSPASSTASSASSTDEESPRDWFRNNAPTPQLRSALNTGAPQEQQPTWVVINGKRHIVRVRLPGQAQRPSAMLYI